MPYQWLEPDLFLEFAGVAVYHCYDEADTVSSSYWYTTDMTDCHYKFPETEAQFDVRDLPNLGLAADDPNNHAAIIQNAIQAGLITGTPAMKMEPATPVVKIEVLGGVAHVVETPPGVEIEIIDQDVDQADQPPDLATLMEWEAEGGCEATDGCWVEVDGTCPHGCKSWLLELGLI